jgi:hypothetical protein
MRKSALAQLARPIRLAELQHRPRKCLQLGGIDEPPAVPERVRGAAVEVPILGTPAAAAST